MKAMIKRIAAVAKKEFIHIRRDKRSIYLSLFLPGMMVLMMGFAINFDVDHIKISVVDYNKSKYSRELIDKLAAGSYFEIYSIGEDQKNSIKELQSGKIKAVVIIDEQFSKNILKGSDVPIQILVDGSNNTTATIASSYMTSIITSYASELAPQKTVEQKLPINLEPRFLYNPELKSTNFIIPGLLVIAMAIMGILLTALTVAREWERGTMEQLLTTPVRPFEIIVGKVLPYILIGLLQIIMALLVAIYVFDCHPVGNIVVLIIYALFFQITILAVGILISATLKAQVVAMQIGMVAAFLPNLLLSGFAFPIGSMPLALQIISYIVPAKYFLIIIRDVFLKGMMWHIIPASCLIGIAFLLLAIASKKTAKEIK